MINKKNTKKLPDSAGVYFFKKNEKILYIGKATSLRDRVKSYFSKDINNTRGPLITKMLKEASEVKVEKTDSVLEALILESKLIKKYQPPYNTRDKSDKSFYYVVITKEKYNRVFQVRQNDLVSKYNADEFLYKFGPFPHSGQLKEALKIIRKIFPFYGEKTTVSKLNNQIGIEPDIKKLNEKEYKNTIKNIKLFFDGKKNLLIKKLEKDMQRFARKEEFEKAEKIKRELFGLKHIRDIALIKEVKTKTANVRIEAYDVSHTKGKEAVGVFTVVEDGAVNKNEYRKFKLKKNYNGSDTDALKEVLERRFAHTEWKLPNIIVVDGGKAQINVAKAVLENLGYEITVGGVVKNTKHRQNRVIGEKIPKNREKDILIANLEAHRFAINYHRYLTRKNT